MALNASKPRLRKFSISGKELSEFEEEEYMINVFDFDEQEKDE